MRSRLRFFCAASAIAFVCLLLASMTWQYVLGLFVLAGVGCGFWSWLTEEERSQARRQVDENSRPAVKRQSGVQRKGNVYQFPLRSLAASGYAQANKAAD